MKEKELPNNRGESLAPLVKNARNGQIVAEQVDIKREKYAIAAVILERAFVDIKNKYPELNILPDYNISDKNGEIEKDQEKRFQIAVGDVFVTLVNDWIIDESNKEGENFRFLNRLGFLARKIYVENTIKLLKMNNQELAIDFLNPGIRTAAIMVTRTFSWIRDLYKRKYGEEPDENAFRIMSKSALSGFLFKIANTNIEQIVSLQEESKSEDLFYRLDVRLGDDLKFRIPSNFMDYFPLNNFPIEQTYGCPALYAHDGNHIVIETIFNFMLRNYIGIFINKTEKMNL